MKTHKLINDKIKNNDFRYLNSEYFQKNSILFYLILIIVIILIYFKTIDYGYVYLDDDVKILDNYSLLTDLNNLSRAFTTDSYFMEGGYYYRPMLTISFFINAYINGNDPLGYHIFNLLLHIAVCCSLLYLFVLMRFDKSASFVLTLFYAVNPLLNNAIIWIPGRNDLMAGLFLILSFIFFLKYSRNHKIYHFIIHILFFSLSIFSKETSLLLPAVILFYNKFIAKEKLIHYSNIINVFCWSIPVILFFILRSNAVKSIEQDTNILSNLIHNLSFLPEILAKFILPFNLSGLPAYNLQLIIPGVIIIFILCFLIYYFAKNNAFPLMIFGLVWTLIFTIPGMLTSPGASRFDYLECRAYIPMQGLLLIFIPLFHKRFSKINENPDSPKKRPKLIPVYSLLIIVVLISYSGLNLYSSSFYSDAKSFYDNAIEKNNNSSLAHNNRGLFNKRLGNAQSAILDFKTAINLNPKFSDPYFNLGSLIDRLGNKREALLLFDRGLSFRPNVPNVLLMKGNIYISLDKLDSAILTFNKALNYDPAHFRAYFSRGTAYLKQKKYRDAIHDFSYTLKFNNNFTKAYANRGLAYSYLMEYKNAVKDYNIAIRIDSINPDIFYNRANCKFLMKDTSSACLDWYKAASFGSQSAANYISRFCR